VITTFLILHQSTIIKKGLHFWKNKIHVSGSAFYVGPKICSDISENLTSLSLIHLENNTKTSCYTANILVDFRLPMLLFCSTLFSAHLFPCFLPLQFLTPLHIRMLIPLCFCGCCFVYLSYLTLSMHFVTLLLFTCETSSIKNYFVQATSVGWAFDPYGLSPTLCDSTMLKHISLLNLKFLMFLYSHQHPINFCFLILFFSLLLHLCCFVIWVMKKHE